MMGTVRARVRGVVREGGRVVVRAVDDAGREYAVEVPPDLAAAAPACSTCGPACGCAPCRLHHGEDPAPAHDHDHEHAQDGALVLVLAWSLHALPSVDAARTTTPRPPHAQPAPAPAPTPTPAATPTPAPASAPAAARRPDPVEVDAAFMQLMACLTSPPATAPEPPSSTVARPPLDPLDELLGLLPGART